MPFPDFLLLLFDPLLPFEPFELEPPLPLPFPLLELLLEPPSSRPQKVASSFICAIIGTRDENKDGKIMCEQGYAVRKK